MKAKINGIKIFTMDCQGIIRKGLRGDVYRWSPVIEVERGLRYDYDKRQPWKSKAKTYYEVSISSLLRCQRAQVKLANQHNRRKISKKASR